MEMSAVNIAGYLSRIGVDATVGTDMATLWLLHARHLRTIPFENLSIHASEPIVLEEGALFDKIVIRRRGGFCYELNGLLAVLLGALGFDVTMISAGVMGGNEEFGPPFDHMALVVQLAERWLVDVGFGSSFRLPLRMDVRAVQSDGYSEYRIVEDNEGLVLERHDDGGSFIPQYRFTPASHELSEYVEMCNFHQTSPESFFTRGRICSRTTEEGRITLHGLQFIQTTLDSRTIIDLNEDSEFDALLVEHFGIVI